MSRAVLFIVMLAVYATQVIAQSTTPAPPAYSTTANDAADSVDQWAKAAKVDIDPDARAAVAEQAQHMDLSNVFVPAQRHEQALAWTKDALVRSYLYAVRDRNRDQASITKAQIEGYTLGEFVKSASASQPFGNVEFLSLPAGASILRDQQEIGRTPMGFIVPGDTHVYDIVLSKEVTCESTIQVRAGTTERMTCPE